MLSVRPYITSDREQVERICLENAGCNDAKDETKKLVLLIYCTYYLENEPENCFVAVDDDGLVCGYILCCENYDEYEKTFTAKYIPEAATISARRYVDAKFNMLKFGMYRKEYPAHFYMNVSVDHQNAGLGGLLLSTLKAHIRKKFVRGIMLVCDAANEDLISFFEKNGFKPLISTMFGRAMGMPFEN